MKTPINRMALVFVGLGMFYAAAPSQEPSKDEMKGRVTKLLSDIVKIDGNQAITIDNSRVEIRTSAIDRITARGFDSVDLLIIAMKDETISFDAFVRCYSACNQILLKVDDELGILWFGGCKITNKDGESRIAPGWQTDEQSFRHRVVEDAEKKRSIANKKKVKAGRR